MPSVHCSITALFHIVISLSSWMVNMSKKMFVTTLMLMCLLFASKASATSLSYPGYAWGKYSVSGENSIANGTFNQGIRFGKFPWIPYGEASYYNNTFGNGAVSTLSGGIYTQLWKSPFKIGACYSYDKAMNNAQSKGQVQGYITMYKEWGFK